MKLKINYNSPNLNDLLNENSFEITLKQEPTLERPDQEEFFWMLNNVEMADELINNSKKQFCDRLDKYTDHITNLKTYNCSPKCQDQLLRLLQSGVTEIDYDDVDFECTGKNCIEDYGCTKEECNNCLPQIATNIKLKTEWQKARVLFDEEFKDNYPTFVKRTFEFLEQHYNITKK